MRLNNDSDDESITVCTFDNADASSFIYEPELEEDDHFKTVEFDGTMHLVKTYDIHMSDFEPCANGYISYSETIPLNRFRKRLSITVDTVNALDETLQTDVQTTKLFVSNGALYATTGMRITDNWNNLTDVEREELILNFRNTTSTFTNELILDMEEVQVVAYATSNSVKVVGQFVGIPNKKIVMPKGLIPTNSFVNILSVDMDYELIGQSNVRMAASEDLEHWYTYKNNLFEWEELPTEIDTTTGRLYPTLDSIYNMGILANNLSKISDWSQFEKGIAFCYLICDENINARAAVDEIRLTVTMRGSWSKYTNGTYAYTKGNLVVRVFDPGDYKINYRKY